MGIEVTGRTAEFGRSLEGTQHGHLFVQTVHKHLDLLAQTGWGGRLSVCMGQQWNIAPLIGHRLEFSDQLVEHRMVHLNQRLFEAVGNGGIVDILRGQSEVDELFVGMQAEFIHLLFEQILDGFDIMVGCPFDLFDPQGVSFGKMAVNIAQGLQSGFVHPFELR